MNTGMTDLVGQKFGKLTVLEDSGQRTVGKNILWRCKCDCGGETLAVRSALTSGNIQSCGCVPKIRAPRNVAEDLTGRQFGDLTVLRRAPNDKDNRVCWVCRCSCGKECVERLKRVTTDGRENKAGFRGLFLTKSGKYRVMITFRKVHYTLGYYPTYDEAVRVRLAAEDQLHNGYLKAFHQYEDKARLDPEWAKDNPFYYDVMRKNGDFQVSTNGI